jgi:hypothetical protein
MVNSLTDIDRAHLQKRGKDANFFIVELKTLLDQIRATKIEKACTAGDGIEVINAIECTRYIQLFEQRSMITSSLFIPASGAATRMFKHLSAIHSLDSDALAEEFIIHFRQFPFFPYLKNAFAQVQMNLEDLVEKNEWTIIIDYLNQQIQFTQLPKALIPFHQYDGVSFNALSEQVREGLSYNKNADGIASFHFTISPEFQDRFLEQKEILEIKYHNQVQITYSSQSPLTDTPALKTHQVLARDKNGEIIFRPAGHGALLNNLQQISSDIIFIKNIDNVAHMKWSHHIAFYKKVLGGLLIELVSKTHLLLRRLEQEGKAALPDSVEFLFKNYGYRPAEEITVNQVFHQLYRPIRVCGMVKNEGEPGGGPFWVIDEHGHITKQIVEKNQIDTAETDQIKCLMQSTHFNPVDIACSIKDHNGKKYVLDKFVDRSTSFISDKFQAGQIIKAIELPGLWNGSMAGWNSLFVEVPNETFHPVKTINDLLRAGHLG